MANVPGGPGPPVNPDSDDISEVPEDPVIDIDDILRIYDEQQAEDAANTITNDNTRVSGSRGSNIFESSTNIGRFDTRRQSTIRQTVRRYVDVPTAAEFLNDFETGFNTYLTSLRVQGQISQFDMELARSQESSFLDDYLGELGVRAALGGNIFEVVGVSQQVQRLGTRPGEVTTTRQRTRERETGGQTTTSQRSGSESQSSQATTTGQTAAGAAAPPQSSQRAESTAVDDRTQGRQQTDTTRTEDEMVQTRQTEEIYARPNLTTVFKTSPMEFMAGKYKDPGMLATVLRGRAGQRFAQEQRGAAGVTSSVTKV